MRNPLASLMLTWIVLAGPWALADEMPHVVTFSGPHFRAITAETSAEIEVGNLGFNVIRIGPKEAGSLWVVGRMVEGTGTEGQGSPQCWFLSGPSNMKGTEQPGLGKINDLDEFLAVLKAADHKASMGMTALLKGIGSEQAAWKGKGEHKDMDEHTKEDQLAWTPLLQLYVSLGPRLLKGH